MGRGVDHSPQRNVIAEVSSLEDVGNIRRGPRAVERLPQAVRKNRLGEEYRLQALGGRILDGDANRAAGETVDELGKMLGELRKARVAGRIRRAGRDEVIHRKLRSGSVLQRNGQQPWRGYPIENGALHVLGVLTQIREKEVGAVRAPVEHDPVVP